MKAQQDDRAVDGPEADGIEQGRRLIRIGGDRGLSLADRLSERFHRLAWRTPLHGLRLKGRYPLKLIAVADDPFLGDPARGNALLDGKLSFRGENHAIDALDLAKPNWSKPFGDYLHSFAWLRDLSTVTTRAGAAPVAEALMRKWLEAHADKVTDPAWRADLWGRRILFWTAHAPLILSSTDLVYRSRVLHTLARGARHLDRTADRVPPGAPRIAAWCGVLVAGLMIPGGDPRRAFGEAGLARALAGSVGEDGGISGRSPAALLDAIMLLTLLRETYAARRLDPPEAQSRALAQMASALLGVCHGDRGLASWQGGIPVDGDTLAEIVAATGARVRPLRQALDWGYQRLAQQRTVLIVDAAPPPVARVMEGGCASTLAFEFSDGPDRIVVSCGGARGADLRLPAALAEGLRTTAAHSTLVVDNSNSTAIHPDGTLGRGVGEMELSRQETDTASRIEASHDGYVRRHGVIHRRRIALGADGRDVRGEDNLIPAGRRRKAAAIPFAVRFHLHPGVQVSPTADGAGALLRTPSGAAWQFRANGATLGIEESVWIDGRGIPKETQQLVLTGESPAGGTSVSWLFHRAR
ncbi:heparinase [Sphingomonas koreensis]|uniref:Heparinase n=1 Tax=Sphingomonas koreensis TaxID=93064 RepID=A0A1L6J816_9SPHN|nr:heparinase II/III family protein [Sphingomonas koreensis]APR51690.1 heparinase [Sphingomonas koreensis]MDC7811858.1 heparinase II/III family protein [Sphingomonas koreensis]RSU21305.1 heparinase [Sphingomonas koreensis]RSU23703.1 heparinase [Sphingomonas koreensis]RSU32130.1 heparinase [Sphingomonas koreensis]